MVTVAFLNHVGAVSGAEQSLLILLAHLDRARVRPVLVCPPGPLAQRADSLGVEVRPWLEARLRRRRPVEGAISLARLAAATATLPRLVADADLLHANSTIAALSAWPVGRPLVWHVRDLRLPQLAVTLLRRRAARVFAISRCVADSLVRGGVDPDRIVHLPNVLDADSCRPRRTRQEVRTEFGLDDGAELVIAVGQLVPWKGHDVLLRAAASLAAERPHLHVLLVGSDLFAEHADWGAHLRHIASEGALRGRVIFAGARGDVPDLLAASDLLVLPSRGEPFGRVLLEAMAVGLPAIATVPGGPAEIVRHGANGWLVWQDDGDGLANALRRGLDLTPKTRRAMGARGREMLRQAFQPRVQARLVAAAYEELVMGDVR